MGTCSAARLRPVGLLLVVLLVLANCAAMTQQQALVVSGTMLDQMGKLFVTTGEQWNRMHTQGVITAQQYAEWATFARWFQNAYPEAVSLWRTAKASRDEVAVGRVESALSAMSTELTRLSLRIYDLLQPPTAPAVK